MAYVPPHRRKGNDVQSPTAEMLAPMPQESLNMGSLGLRHSAGSSQVRYARTAVSRWLAVGSNGKEIPPPTFILQYFPLERVERTKGKKPFMLVKNDGVVSHDTSEKKPWKYIAERVLQDLVSSSEFMKTQMEGSNKESEETRLKLEARVGRVLFLPKGTYVREVGPGKYAVGEASLEQFWRTFCPDVPASFTKTVTDEVVPNIGFILKDVKEVYSVKLSDKRRPGARISCKCRVAKEDGKRLDMYKIELNNVRHMVYDISCLEKRFDLKLILSAKRTLTTLMHDDEESIRRLIDSAVLDSDLKDGLRWPIGSSSSPGGRYEVTGVLHTTSRSYTSPSLRLKVQDADWIDLRTSIGKVLREVILKFKEIPTKLLEKNTTSDSVSDMLVDALKLLWENFLHSD